MPKQVVAQSVLLFDRWTQEPKGMRSDGLVPENDIGIASAPTVLQANGISACTCLMLWDKKTKTGLLVQIPKEDGVLDAISTKKYSILDDNLYKIMKLFLSHAQGKEMPLNLDSDRDYMRENVVARVFGGEESGLSHIYAATVRRVREKIKGFLQEHLDGGNIDGAFGAHADEIRFDTSDGRISGRGIGVSLD
jgi:hypothetical protein